MDNIPNNSPNSTGQQMGNFPQGNNYAQQPQAPSPAEIYNANTTATGPQYHYGTPQNFFNVQYLEEQRKKLLERRNHEKIIKSFGAYAKTMIFASGVNSL